MSSNRPQKLSYLINIKWAPCASNFVVPSSSILRPMIFSLPPFRLKNRRTILMSNELPGPQILSYLIISKMRRMLFHLPPFGLKNCRTILISNELPGPQKSSYPIITKWGPCIFACLHLASKIVVPSNKKWAPWASNFVVPRKLILFLPPFGLKNRRTQ